MKLKGRCAIVTGGATGIGLATCKRLLKEGVIVTIWDLNLIALDQAHQQLAQYGKIFLQSCDVTKKEQVYQLAQTAFIQMGRVDILINNAGYVSGGDFLERPDADWERTINVNLHAILYTTRAFLPGMYERNYGYIVNISSAAGIIGIPGHAVYAATKSAVWALTESLRMEALNNGKTGVRFSSIHPTCIDTGMFEGAKPGIPVRWIIPNVKNHDVIAKAIVEDALKKEKYSPKRPRTLNLAIRFRALLPDRWFQRLLLLIGFSGSMKTWYGKKEKVVEPLNK